MCVLFERIVGHKNGMTWIRTDNVSARYLRALNLTSSTSYAENGRCAVSRKQHNAGSYNGVDIGTFTRLSCCECVCVVSEMKFSKSFTLSALVLFVFHSMSALSFHTSPKRSFNTAWP